MVAYPALQSLCTQFIIEPCLAQCSRLHSFAVFAAVHSCRCTVLIPISTSKVVSAIPSRRLAYVSDACHTGVFPPVLNTYVLVTALELPSLSLGRTLVSAESKPEDCFTQVNHFVCLLCADRRTAAVSVQHAHVILQMHLDVNLIINSIHNCWLKMKTNFMKTGPAVKHVSCPMLAAPTSIW
jgi:hypothetical protein